MSRLTYAALLLGLLAGGAASAEPSDESPALHAAQSAAEREGDRLVLHIRDGADVIFLDQNHCDEPDLIVDQCLLHRLVAFDLDHRIFVVENDYYEGRGFEWVSAISGAKAKLIGLPNYSPDGTRFVAIGNDEMSNNPGPGVQIWRVELGLPTLEWFYTPHEYALYAFNSWQGNNEVDLSVMIRFRRELVTFPAHLILDPRPGWGWYLTVDDAGIK